MLFTVWVVFNVIGVLANIASIGKPRKAITSGQAASVMISSLIWIVLFWWAFIL